jgi:hypothetical protein
MKRTVLVAALLLSFVGAKAQTNIQEMYDFGRKHMTTTLEMYSPDNWGSTFFFVDIYHTNNIAPTDFYTEIARTINFWGKNTSIGDVFVNNISLHVEWNGGCGIYDMGTLGWGGYPVNNAWLYGIEYFIANNDFSQRLTLEVMYKDIRGIKAGFDKTANVPLQFTAVWGLDNLFGVPGLSFCGFADFWWENNVWASGNTTTTTFLTEPQLWYKVGRHFGCDNLNIGGEVEISNNFSGAGEGWSVKPCLGIKWEF